MFTRPARIFLHTIVVCLLTGAVSEVHAFSFPSGTTDFAGSQSTPPPPPPSSSPKNTRGVKVQILRLLPNLSTPSDARRIWLQYVWEQGGGLPLFIATKASRSATSRPQLETTVQRRLLLPIGMEEELVLEEKGDDVINIDDILAANEEDEWCKITYQVKNSGLLATEIVPDTHLGTVTFARSTTTSEGQQIQMTWDVTFDTTSDSRTFLWQAMTERTITDTCNNLVAKLATPKLYTRHTILRPKNNNNNNYNNDQDVPSETMMTPQSMMEEWIQFCWKEGAGFPLPIPPILVGREVRWIVPPFLRESLVSAKTVANTIKDPTSTNRVAEIQYRVDNPSLFTYQVHSHCGRVQFLVPDDDRDTTLQGLDDDHKEILPIVIMQWQVEIRPYHGWSSVVQAFTGAVISCYARNFKCHVQEGSESP